MTSSRPAIYLALCMLTVLFASGADVPEGAVKKVQQGLRHYQSQDYASAETAFSEAEELSPENSVILFDKACAALAGDDPEQARALFQKVTLAKDVQLSLDAHYNLGCLEGELAREKLGDDPAAATGETRDESIKLLLAAARHYRNVLRTRPDHANARHNLELIRIFIKHIQSQWAERDRQQARDEKDLLQFLEMIQEKEEALRSVVRRLENETDSASKRLAVKQTVEAQRTLQEEIEPLKSKITEQLQASQSPSPAAPAAGAAPAVDEQMQQIQQLLHGFADNAGEQMLNAAESLDTNEFVNTDDAQTQALNHLHQLYLAVAPYQNLLQRALQDQQRLIPAEAEDPNAADTVSTENDETAGSDDDADDTTADVVTESPSPGEPTSNDSEDAAIDELDVETQAKISDFSRMLSLKAEAELPAVQRQLDAMPPASPDNSDATDKSDVADDDKDDSEEQEAQDSDSTTESEHDATIAGSSSPEDPSVAQQQQQREQLQGLVESMQLAIERAPEAEEHSIAAGRHLSDNQRTEGTSEQQETLRILKEIAEPLKSDDQNKNQDQQEQDQNQNEDQKNESQDSQDQQQQKSSDQKKSQQDRQQQSQQDQQKKQSQQQAESVLRKARDRERKHRDMQKQLRAILGGRIKVDKDW